MTLLACVARASALAASRPTTIPIVAEGPDWLVVHKPADVPCHRRGANRASSSSWTARRIMVPHRLDDGTSGCLVLAEAGGPPRPSGQRAAKRVAKVYVGLTASRPSKKKAEEGERRLEAASGGWRELWPNPACTWLSRSIGLGPGEGPGRAPPRRETADGERSSNPKKSPEKSWRPSGRRPLRRRKGST